MALKKAAFEPRPAAGQEQGQAGLDSPDPAVRRHAARAMAGDPAAVGALCERLQREEDVAVWEAILTSLAQTGGAQAAAGLFRFLDSDRAQLRNEILDALRTFREAELLPHVEALLHDRDPRLRMAVIQLCPALERPTAERLLSDVLERDEHVNVCATAVDILAEIGTPATLPALERARRRFGPVPFMTFAIDTAEARIGGGGPA